MGQHPITSSLLRDGVFWVALGLILVLPIAMFSGQMGVDFAGIFFIAASGAGIYLFRRVVQRHQYSSRAGNTTKER